MEDGRTARFVVAKARVWQVQLDWRDYPGQFVNRHIGTKLNQNQMRQNKNSKKQTNSRDQENSKRTGEQQQSNTPAFAQKQTEACHA